MPKIEAGSLEENPPRWLELKNSLVIPDVGVIRMTEDQELKASVEIEVKYSRPLDRYISTSVSVVSDGEREISGAMLRDVRVLEIMQQGLMDLVHSRWDPDNVALAADVISTFEPISGRTNSLVMEQVAFVYRVARVTGNRPLKEVARVFEVSHSTAIRLLARAREEKRLVN